MTPHTSMTTMPTHAVWHDGTDMNAATHIGRGTTTDVSTAGMDGVRSMTHGIIAHGITTHGIMTHGIMAMQDGTEAGMPDGTTHGSTAMPDGMEDGTPTPIGDGMVTTILYMAAAVADIGQVPLNASRTTDSHAQAPPESVAAA